MTPAKPQPLRRGKGISMLVYGVPGAGKTRLLGSAERTLVIRPPVDHTDSIETPGNVKELVVSDWSGMLEAFQYLQQGGHEEFDWVWFDSISLFQDLGLDDIMADAIAKKPTRAIERGGQKIPEYGPDQGEYKINFDRVAKWVRDMTGLADAGLINFGITAHPFEWYDPIRQEDVWAPWVQGRNMSPKVCGYMNVVAYLRVVRRKDGSTVRVLLTEAEGFVGKDQYSAFPTLKNGDAGIVEPTMAKVMSAIETARGTKAPGATKKATAKRRRRSTK